MDVYSESTSKTTISDLANNSFESKSMKNRLWILANRPVGNNYNSALKLIETPIRKLEAEEILIRNRVLSMDSGTRMYMTEREDSFQDGVPLGSPMLGTVIGEVVETQNLQYKIGDIVRCYGNWSDYSVVNPSTTYAAKLNPPLRSLEEYVGILGANGWTAYVGVMEVGAPKKGETFVVSAAAGCTGIMAGQIAKIAGCTVIGICGTDTKCDLLTREYGFDTALNYKTSDIRAELAACAPQGVDIYFDNVGGAILDAVMPNLNNFGRIPICGLITNYIADEKVPGPEYFDLVLMKRLRIEGFFSPDFYAREHEFNPILTKWNSTNQLKLPFDVTNGLVNTVTAYSKLFSGENIGKVVVKLPNN